MYERGRIIILCAIIFNIKSRCILSWMQTAKFRRFSCFIYFFLFLLFFASNYSHLKAKIFLLRFFYIHVIYMRALKDDARFDLFLSIYCLYRWKKENLYRCLMFDKYNPRKFEEVINIGKRQFLNTWFISGTTCCNLLCQVIGTKCMYSGI